MATYYIDYVSGSDSNNGTSTSTPWKHCRGMVGATGTAASATFSAGDAIYFKAGVTWPASVLPWQPPNFSGSLGNPITYSVASGWGSGSYAILDGGGTASGIIQQNNNPGPNYLVFDGFEAKNPTSTTTVTAAPIYLRSSDPATIQNCKTSATGINAQIYVQRTTSIINCYIDGSNSTAEAVVDFQGTGYSANDAEDSILRGNTIITGGATYGVKFYGAGNATIEKNYIYGNTSNGQYLLVNRSSRKSTIRYNVFRPGSLSGGGGVMVAWTAGQVTDANQGHRYYNNTLIGNGTGTGFLSPSNDYDDLEFYNNIFYDFATGIESPSDATITTNAFWSCSTNWGGGGTLTTSGNITTDPQLTNTASLPGGAALQSGSPARDTGTSFHSYHNGVNTDYAGVIVPQNGTPDMGAYEFSVTTSSGSVVIFIS